MSGPVSSVVLANFLIVCDIVKPPVFLVPGLTKPNELVGVISLKFFRSKSRSLQQLSSMFKIMMQKRRRSFILILAEKLIGDINFTEFFWFYFASPVYIFKNNVISWILFSRKNWEIWILFYFKLNFRFRRASFNVDDFASLKKITDYQFHGI